VLYICHNSRVEASHKQVGEFKTAKGVNYYREWLDSLKDLKGKAQIQARVKRLSAGNFGDCKPVGDGVHELRIDFGPGYRVYFGEHERRIVILLCGGNKGSQSRDIRLARRLWKEAKEIL
jgi:putative addiction module killer protein